MKLIQRLSDKVSEFDAMDWRRKLGLRALVFFTITGTACLLAWNLTGFGPAYRHAPDVYWEIETGGTPLSAEGFARWVSVPDADNAAPKLLPLLKKLEFHVSRLTVDQSAVMSGKAALLSKLEPSQDQLVALALQFESDIRDVKGQLGYPKFVPKRDWRRPEQVLFPEYAWLRAASKALSLSARARASRGDYMRAVEDLQAGITLARYAGDTPVLIGYLVEIACRAITSSAAQKCMQFDPAHAQEYAAVFEENQIHGLGRFIRGETYIALGSCRNLNVIQVLRDLSYGCEDCSDDFIRPEEPQVGKTSGLPNDPFVRAMAARLLDRYAKLLASIGTDDREKFPGALTKALLANENEPSGTYLDRLADIVMPVFGQSIIDSGLGAKASDRLTRALGSIVAFRKNKGRWPKSLEEAGVHTTDPYTKEQPLRYRVTRTEVRVWSVYRDRTDDGGYTTAERDAKRLDTSKRDLIAVFTY